MEPALINMSGNDPLSSQFWSDAGQGFTVPFRIIGNAAGAAGGGFLSGAAGGVEDAGKAALGDNWKLYLAVAAAVALIVVLKR